MQYLLTPHANAIDPWTWWDGAFTEQELNWLQNKAKQAEIGATIGRTNETNTEFRRCQISWLSNTSDTKWVFDKFAQVASKINAQYYQFDLTGFGETLQLTNYNQSENGMYGWHQDCGGGGVSRKLSMAMQLSDPSEYEGGDLQIKTGAEPVTVNKKRGLIAVFPSYTLHQVTPVTQGSRQSLVAWVSGPAFK